MEKKLARGLLVFVLCGQVRAQEVAAPYEVVPPPCGALSHEIIPFSRGTLSNGGGFRFQQPPSLSLFNLKATETEQGEDYETNLRLNDFSSRFDSLTATTTKSSRGKAFLRSLLIPGWGQKSIGAKTSARNFFVAELTLWAGFIAFQVRGHWLEEDYRLFGETHAGFNPAGKENRFFVDVGNFNSIDEYNQARLRDRDVAALYDPVAYFWKWDSEANRLRYDDIRVRSESAYTNSSFMIAGVLANHVISGIHAAYLARRREQSKPQGVLPSPQFYVESSPRDIRFVARLEF